MHASNRNLQHVRTPNLVLLGQFGQGGAATVLCLELGSAVPRALQGVLDTLATKHVLGRYIPFTVFFITGPKVKLGCLLFLYCAGLLIRTMDGLPGAGCVTSLL